ncbi:MFS transporter [Photobacterium kasasachensis]|uniref:MFS transporter n=1 Tax=Photobacterium kasasachensis TaxID=2910240 RepID=UPI003D0E0DB0
MAISKKFALAIVFSLVPLGPLAIDVYLPSFPQMVEAFGASDSEIRQTIAIYVLALGMSQLIAGPISDKRGRKFSALLGLFLYAAGSLSVVVSESLLQLYLSRALQGVGASFTMITAMAWVRDNYQGVNAGRLLSYIGGVTSAIPTIAPLIGSGLAMFWGWTGGFYLMAILALALIVLTLLGLETKGTKSVTVDVDNTQALKCNLKNVLSSKVFRTYSLANMLSFGGVLTYVSVAPIVSMKDGEIGQVEFSVLFGVIGGMQVIASLVAPKLMALWGRQSTVLSGASLVVVAGIGLLFTANDAIYVFFAMAALGSAGFSLLSGSAISLALEPFQNCAGLASSIDGFLRMIGGALLVAISGYLDLSGIATLAVVYLLSFFALAFVVMDKKSVHSAAAVE